MASKSIIYIYDRIKQRKDYLCFIKPDFFFLCFFFCSVPVSRRRRRNTLSTAAITRSRSRSRQPRFRKKIKRSRYPKVPMWSILPLCHFWSTARDSLWRFRIGTICSATTTWRSRSTRTSSPQTRRPSPFTALSSIRSARSSIARSFRRWFPTRSRCERSKAMPMRITKQSLRRRYAVRKSVPRTERSNMFRGICSRTRSTARAEICKTRRIRNIPMSIWIFRPVFCCWTTAPKHRHHTMQTELSWAVIFTALFSRFIGKWMNCGMQTEAWRTVRRFRRKTRWSKRKHFLRRSASKAWILRIQSLAACSMASICPCWTKDT